MTLGPFEGWRGSRSPKLVIVGEAWGEAEALAKRPFIGPAGQELQSQLLDARIPESEVGMTNVFNFRPEGNAIGTLCCSKKELPNDYPTDLAPLGRTDAKHFPRGPFLRPEYLPELKRLREELEDSHPNLVFGVGATAAWALLGVSAISSIRGTTTMGAERGPSQGMKVLVTYHPAAILHGRWEWRIICIADLMKAWREAQSPKLERPERTLLVSPSIEALELWAGLWTRLKGVPLGVDIETSKGLITCISFANGASQGLVVPFRGKAGTSNFWESPELELRAWMAVRQLLECGRPLVFQNGMYDAQYLMRMGFDLRGMSEDTMLLHHALYPELQKSLGFLGSIYTNEQSWKLFSKHRITKVKGEKLDD